jgi:hypothetical protein
MHSNTKTHLGPVRSTSSLGRQNPGNSLHFQKWILATRRGRRSLSHDQSPHRLPLTSRSQHHTDHHDTKLNINSKRRSTTTTHSPIQSLKSPTPKPPSLLKTTIERYQNRLTPIPSTILPSPQHASRREHLPPQIPQNQNNNKSQWL